MNPSTQSGGSGRRPGASVATEDPSDPRLAAFADFVDAHDAHDWRAGQVATRRLRALGYSVCLLAPRDGRGGTA
jgi:hypothetical protein